MCGWQVCDVAFDSACRPPLTGRLLASYFYSRPSLLTLAGTGAADTSDSAPSNNSCRARSIQGEPQQKPCLSLARQKVLGIKYQSGNIDAYWIRMFVCRSRQRCLPSCRCALVTAGTRQTYLCIQLRLLLSGRSFLNTERILITSYVGVWL